MLNQHVGAIVFDALLGDFYLKRRLIQPRPLLHSEPRDHGVEQLRGPGEISFIRHVIRIVSKEEMEEGICASVAQFRETSL